jgi:hypothetical protein
VIESVEAEPTSVVELMTKAQRGDRDAFRELELVGREQGIS